MAAETLPSAESLRHPDQPPFIYDIHKPWEEVVANPPIWLGKKPPLPTEAKYTILGKPTISPMVIAAGPANGRLWTTFFLEMGFGGVIEKTKRTVPRQSNQMYNIAMVCSDEPLTPDNIDTPRLGSLNPEDWAIYKAGTNSFGNPCKSMPEWGQEYRFQLMDVSEGQQLWISVTPTFEELDKSTKELRDEISDPETREKYEEFLAETQNNVIASDVLLALANAVGAGAEAAEVNEACPNVQDNAVEGEMFQDAKLTGVIFRGARRFFPGKKLGIKVGRFSTRDQARRVLNETAGNLDYVASINALSVPIVDEQGRPVLEGRLRAGTCGEPLRELSLRQTEMLADIRAQDGLPIDLHVGGGILEPEHVDQYKNAGADRKGDAYFTGIGCLANPLMAYERRLYELGLYQG